MDSNLLFYASKKEWSPSDEAAVLKMEYPKRAELARSINCEGLLVDLSLDQHPEVRKGVAANAATPITTLRRLAEQDLCISVQEKAQETLKEQTLES
ncbi:hypothetical protein BBI15_06500 [Planococcus plakortidis]|uniref:Uncharacterized protein n=1 Tax=Planococcus plakortidis TaxID=1038856 RepID=A0A1C7E843_9BACL|nr:hypothetical protein [Planococcus plakortidis]ANU19886.1 hypothetical protein BBI15_06500 [Planococcus plakortidis]